MNAVVRTRDRFVRFLLVLTLAVPQTGCPTYAERMRDKLKSLFPDFGSYQFLAYPTNNFGVGTMYILKKRGSDAGDDDYWCSAEACLATSVSPIGFEQTLNVYGYATLGSGGSVALSEEEQTTFGAKVLLPELSKALGLKTGLDYEKGVTVNLRFDEALVRRLDRSKFFQHLSDLPSNNPVKIAFLRGRLGVVVADIVIKRMSMSISIDSKLNAGLIAELDKSANKTAGEPSKFEINFKSASSGAYELLTTRPVVAATRLAIQDPDILGRSVGIAKLKTLDPAVLKEVLARARDGFGGWRRASISSFDCGRYDKPRCVRRTGTEL